MSIVKWMVNTWDDNPRRCEFVKETAQFYIKSNRSRESKVSRYHDIFDTEQEALDFIQSRKQKKEEKKRMDRIREAAPELLEACQAFKRLYGRLWDVVEPSGSGFLSPESVKEYDAIHELMTAAIAKATA
ncbi:hypothetical protein IPC72_25425 [Pseudomonas aeruginosa]|uniref:hypothetical protein n=1 Tax=Pseudomonas aeruginosa TaxID=287 RepID=UPI0010682209|nr:hypothetical protein [Pseudomonas aeruginosa]TEP56576.1 hypothetical protein IPC72_25425 [Pseudomonas aeruginosa]TEP75303.1 hypothetical protein IPC71_20365 [Pseudomonas aeruginosa]HCL4400166.1 hypothetical protein [Pseudomonas aeruginosa]